jgi:hypothetical protein
MEPPSRVSIYAWNKAANHNCHSFHHKGCSAQSLGRAGLSSRHLPCDSRSTYRISVRCLQNFESFSIDWCRCEVLRTPHLFSVPLWKCKVLSCSPCIFKFKCTATSFAVRSWRHLLDAGFPYCCGFRQNSTKYDAHYAACLRFSEREGRRNCCLCIFTNTTEYVLPFNEILYRTVLHAMAVIAARGFPIWRKKSYSFWVNFII